MHTLPAIDLSDLRQVQAPRGTAISCKGWRQEAALRMILNNLEVGERPQDLVIYGEGKVARDPACLAKILATLRTLADDETLLIQSGKPVGVFKTHTGAPRVLIANANLVPHWATKDEFDALARLGLTMYGQMTAGSWIYIGTQGIIQGTYETFRAAAEQHFDGTLKGRTLLTAGLGGMGRAQPLAVKMNDGVCLVIEVDHARIARALRVGYLDEEAENLDDALRRVREYAARGEGRSIGLLANAAETHPELARRGVHFDLVTDQTSAHDEIRGYLPAGLTLAEAEALRTSDREAYKTRALDSMAEQVRAMLAMQAAGSLVFEYGNGLRRQVTEDRVPGALQQIPGYVPAFIRPHFAVGRGPFRWAALSGDPEDIYRTDAALLELFPHDAALARWLRLARQHVPFEGLPARICWLAYGERDRAGLAFNDLVRRGVVTAPIVIGRDHHDSGSVASPTRETEAMRDGSDAIADWPILNALLNTASGADWVSYHHGGGVGIGYALHSGVVIVADGTDSAAERIQRVLTNDPGSGVMRHADAGYPDAIDAMRQGTGFTMPMLDD